MLTMSSFSLADFLTLVIQFVIPLLVGLVTKKSTNAKLKVSLLTLLTAANQFFVGWLAAGNHFGWKQFLANIILGVVASVAAHFGVWKPTGATDAAQNTMVVDTTTTDTSDPVAATSVPATDPTATPPTS